MLLANNDFKSFCCSGEKRSSQKTVNSLIVEIEKRDFSYGVAEQVFINIYAKAKSFLWHQVRKMVGAIVEVGSGALSLTQLKSIIDAKDPNKCPPMAPAHGLYFLEAEYEPYEVIDRCDHTFKAPKRSLEIGEADLAELPRKKQKT